MPQRRINDAQVERLLSALQSREYRQQLARKLAAKEDIKYASAMRRLQRYVTTGAQKRTFARAPLDVRRATVKTARTLPVPADYLPKPKTIPWAAEPEQLPLPAPRPTFYRDDIPPAPVIPTYRETGERDVNNYDLRAILAYYDGDSDEAGRVLQTMGADNRAGRLLELAATSADVLAMRGAGRLSDAIREWFDVAGDEDAQDVEDFRDLLMNLPDWQIEMILEDMQKGDTSFADWMDAWRDANMDIDSEDNDYWRLWREAYARAKK